MAIAVLHPHHNHAAMDSLRQNRRVMKRISSNTRNSSSPSSSILCSHRRLWTNFCIDCGKKVRNHQSIQSKPYSKPLIHNPIHNRIVVNPTHNRIVDRKLCLVLDLDHTLLNSIPMKDLTVDEEYLKTKDDSYRSGLVRILRLRILTKLRPFVRSFLSEVSKMFELYVYTMADRSYALEMAKLLDPEGKYFKRIISRDDHPAKNYKELDVLGKPIDSVLILDDNEIVWPNHKENLILMDKYVYFASSCRQLGFTGKKSLSELKRDENEVDGALSTVLKVLKQIHHVRSRDDNVWSRDDNVWSRDVVNDNVRSREEEDVREVLKTVRKQVLKGCKVVFSGVFPRNLEGSEHRLWKMAEELGATCCKEVEEGVTHVVAVDGGTEKSRWAVVEGRFLVSPRWVEASFFLWKRQLEEKFQVGNKWKVEEKGKVEEKIEVVNKSINRKFWYVLEKDKLHGTNFIDWYQSLRLVLKIDRKEYVLETPLPPKPKDSAPKSDHDAFTRHKNHSHEVTQIMLLTMNPEFQKHFQNVEAYDILSQLKNWPGLV